MHLLRIFKRYSSSKQRTLVKSQLELFEKLSKDWWDKNGTLKLLHSQSSIRIPCIQRFLRNSLLCQPAYIHTATPLAGIKILDVGCGGGIVSEALAELGAHVIGVDPGQDLIKIAKLHLQKMSHLQHNIEYRTAFIEDCDDFANVFDVVIASEVIEHVTNPDVFVRCCAQCVKPGGSMIFTTISQTRIAEFLYIYLLENVVKTIPKGTHEFEKFVHAQALSTMINSEGFKTVDINGYVFNVLLNKWTTFPTTWFHYALHAIKV